MPINPCDCPTEALADSTHADGAGERANDIDDGEGRMSVKQCLFRLWVKLTVLSVLVDIASFWLVDHTPAAVPGSDGPNYLLILLVSAPAPIVLAVVLTLVGLFCSLSGWGLEEASSRLASARSRAVRDGP
jgi:hypothetical protein